MARRHVAVGARVLQVNSGRMGPMAKTHKGTSAQRTCDELTVSHRERLIGEVRADPTLAADYLNAAAEDGDARVYLAALRTVAEAKRMA